MTSETAREVSFDTPIIATNPPIKEETKERSQTSLTNPPIKKETRERIHRRNLR